MVGQISTFYSYKGGVGRSMGLANIAALLSKWRMKVLIVDWDLEAPGIEAYFQSAEPKLAELRKKTPGIIDLVKAFEIEQPIDWHDCLLSLKPFDDGENLSIISAGKDDGEYINRVQNTNWNNLFKANNLGNYIEKLRNDWKQEFDFILVDSRTGNTDIGGICTIHIPDYLLVWFTTNQSSLDGVSKVATHAIQTQDRLPFDRNPLWILPVPARDESRTEYALADSWKKKIAEEFGHFYSDWLPSKVEPIDVIERIRIPYVPFWSFGERLPVIDEGTSDINSIGFAYELLSRQIFYDFDWSLNEIEPEKSEKFLSRAVKADILSFGQEYADRLFNKALILQKEDTPDQVSDLMRQAVEIWQQLPEKNFADYGLNLARASEFLSDNFEKENNIHESILEMTKAVATYRKLYKIRPSTYKEDLTRTLAILFKRLVDFGDIDKAVNFLHGNINFDFQDHELSKSLQLQPDLAEAFLNLANILIETSDYSEALFSAEKAVDIYQNLMNLNKKVYQQDLASSLTTYSECLFQQGETLNALSKGKKAVEIFKELTQKSPSRYERDLVSSINSLLDQIAPSIENALPETLLFVQDAVNSFRELNKKDSKRYGPDLARSINLLPYLSSDLNQAIQSQEEAIKIFENLSVTDPTQFEPELAASLINLSKLLERDTKITEARDVIQKALKLYEKIAIDSSKDFDSELEEAKVIRNRISSSQ